MNRNLTLSVPNRCSQNWSSFTQVGGGGFCGSCSKVVVDFTTMSDKQIIEHFKNAPGETCGRFLPHQLKTFTPREYTPIQPGFMVLKAGLVSLLLLGAAKSSNAQLPKQKQKTEMPSTYRVTQDSISFRGVVLGAEDRSPLPGVNVVLKGSTIGTVTDSEGRFEFPKALRKDDVLIFSFIGLTTKEYTVDGKKEAGLEVPMQLCMDMEVMGGVQVEGIYTEEKRGLWSRVKAFFGV